jgi:hypothetical protein
MMVQPSTRRRSPQEDDRFFHQFVTLSAAAQPGRKMHGIYPPIPAIPRGLSHRLDPEPENVYALVVLSRSGLAAAENLTAALLT